MWDKTNNNGSSNNKKHFCSSFGLIVFLNVMKHLQCLFVLIALMCVQSVFAQGASIGKFYDHLPYNKANSIAVTRDKVFVGSGQTMFTYDLNDGSLETLSKVNVLSDLGVTAVAYSEKYNKVIVGYETGNIDFIIGNTVVNIPDVVRTSIQGFKNINDIFIWDDFAYLSTGFGIIKLDIDKNEIKETYLIGDNATNVFVNGVTVFNDSIFAATTQGIYKARLEGTNLVDFQNWEQSTKVAQVNYESICSNDEIMLFNRVLDGENNDTILSYDGSAWQPLVYSGYANQDVKRIQYQNDEWQISHTFGAEFISKDFTTVTPLELYSFSLEIPQPRAFVKNNGIWWVADNRFGLVSYVTGKSEQFLPAGPASFQAWDMDFQNDELWVASGSLTPSRVNNFLKEGIYVYRNNEWTSYNGGEYNEMFDIITISASPTRPGEVFVGSWGEGLRRVIDGKIDTASYKQNNSTVTPNSVFEYYTIGDTKYDNNGVLWTTVAGLSGANVQYPIIAFDGENWFGYGMENKLVTETHAGEIAIDNAGNKWFVSDANGVFVFNENGTFDDEEDDQVVLITTGEDKGNLPTKNVNCLAIDMDGKVWIGTDEGLTIISSTNGLYDGEVRAERIIIEQEGSFEYLLETEIITTIKVDGANRKWIGTETGGVYLVSEDGLETIHHFTTETTPLLSNTIFDVEIFGSTGEVFFATDKGLMSYIGDATDEESYEGPTYAFPNPVRPEYDGIIGIRGLAPNAEVKITDISGNLIYETFSKGTTATWDGNSLNGKRAQTGVYIVFSVTDDGEQKEVTKILFIN